MRCFEHSTRIRHTLVKRLRTFSNLRQNRVYMVDFLTLPGTHYVIKYPHISFLIQGKLQHKSLAFLRRDHSRVYDERS